MRYYKTLTFITMFVCFSSFANEDYFLCDIGKGVARLNESNGMLRYTLTKNNNEEFSFESKGDDFSGFNYNHYSRFQTDYFNVSFMNSGYKYTIFSHYEDGNESRGVSVMNLKSSKETVYECKSAGVDHLSDLSGKLACDKATALGCD
ncbi:hypothetical protein [Yersinia mollaretii]|uniref:hypothetical protein n=1 Tax=Yersinia mollaretii TaxID=33060 RepID=UPI0005DCCD09|nr:hypothetical protein [Yersinia mollaretii]PJE88592.1 hypothetical protein CU280_05615 [Yersinia mollaretii]CQD32704.1 Uncharacterised protein [Yersinia mollaretii]CQG95368.1 Uncharacterised protein [Yersinia mollaretii]